MKALPGPTSRILCSSPWSPNRMSEVIYTKYFIQCAVVVQLLSCARLFATPWTVAHQAPLWLEFSRQEYWSRLLFPSPWDLPNPGIEPGSPALQVDSLTSEPPGSLIRCLVTYKMPGESSSSEVEPELESRASVPSSASLHDTMKKVKWRDSWTRYLQPKKDESFTSE